jgi:signal transduction histidine kinase
VAERHLHIAAKATDAPPATRQHVAESLGDVLMLQGHYEAALTQLQRALQDGSSVEDEARIAGKVGELESKRGRVVESCAAFERGLGLLGQSVPRSRLGLMARLAWEACVQAAHTLLPRWTVGRRAGPSMGRALLVAQLHSRMCYAYWFARGAVPTLWSHLKGLNVAERYPASPELAQAYSEHAPVMTVIPWFSRGARYAEKSHALRQAFGDVWGQGQSLHFLGTALYGASRFREALETLQRAARILERTGDLWEANTARWHIALAHYRLGALREAAEHAERVYRIATRIDDRQARGISLGIWARATQGQVPRALLEEAHTAIPDDAHTRAEALHGLAAYHLRRRDTAAAVAALRDADAQIRRQGLRQDYVVAVVPALATALRLHLEALPPTAPRRRRAILNELGQVSRRAFRLSRAYRNNRPHAARELAAYWLLRGRHGRALRLCDLGLSVAVAQGARLEEARLLLLRGRVRQDVSPFDPAAEHDLRAGRALLAETGARPDAGADAQDSLPFARSERFERALEMGRGIATATHQAAVLDQVTAAATTLLRADAAAVAVLTDDGLQDLRTGAPAAVSRTLFDAALRDGAPVIHDEGLPATPVESMVFAGTRSALCAPIRARGTPQAALWVSSSQFGRLFGPEDAQLSAFIASLAGAALDNAAAFAEREAWVRAAREAVAARDAFLSVASHELRTPVTGLKLQVDGVVRVAQKHGEIEAAGRLAAKLPGLQRQLTRLGELVALLMDVSTLAAGQLELRLEPLDLRALVVEALARHAPMLEDAGCSVTLDVAPSQDWSGTWDRLRLEQVIANLLSNAAKYGARAPVEVTLRADDTHVRLAVRDHGIGIAPADQQRIFERFERAASARHYAGLGLGLWVSHALVVRHHGELAVDSEPGAGACFTMCLPRRTPAAS